MQSWGGLDWSGEVLSLGEPEEAMVCFAFAPRSGTSQGYPHRSYSIPTPKAPGFFKDPPPLDSLFEPPPPGFFSLSFWP